MLRVGVSRVIFQQAHVYHACCVNQELDSITTKPDCDAGQLLNATQLSSVLHLFQFYRDHKHFFFDRPISITGMVDPIVPYNIFAIRNNKSSYTCVSMHQLCLQWVFFSELHKFFLQKIPKCQTSSNGESVTLTGCQVFHWKQISHRLGFTVHDLHQGATETDGFVNFLRQIPEIHVSFDRFTSEVKYTLSYRSLVEKYRWMNTHTFWNRIAPLPAQLYHPVKEKYQKGCPWLHEHKEIMNEAKGGIQPRKHYRIGLVDTQIGNFIDSLHQRSADHSYEAILEEVSSVLSICRNSLKKGSSIPLNRENGQILCRYLVYVYNSIPWRRSTLHLRRKIKVFISLTQTLQNFVDPKKGSTCISTFEDKLIFSLDHDSRKENRDMKADMLGNKDIRPFPQSKS